MTMLRAHAKGLRKGLALARKKLRELATKRATTVGFEPFHAAPKPARNAPCPCKSGRKYKACCQGAVVRNRGPVPGEAFRAAVPRCGGCGKFHAELIFFPTRPPGAAGPTHFSTCPAGKQALQVAVRPPQAPEPQ